MIARRPFGKILGEFLAEERQHHVERPAACGRTIGSDAIGTLGETGDQAKVARAARPRYLFDLREQRVERPGNRRDIFRAQSIQPVPGDPDPQFLAGREAIGPDGDLGG